VRNGFGSIAINAVREGSLEEGQWRSTGLPHRVEGLYAAGRSPITTRPSSRRATARGSGSPSLTTSTSTYIAIGSRRRATSPIAAGRYPTGTEEIDEEERERREREFMGIMCEFFAEPHHDGPTPHPGLIDDE
jgi:hypothetical protein